PALNLLQDEVMVAVVVKRAARVVKDTIERFTGDQCKIILTLAPGHFPQLIKEKGRGDDRGAAVEFEAVDLIDIGAPAKLVALLKEHNLMAARGQPHRRGQPAKAAANYDDFLLHPPPWIIIMNLENSAWSLHSCRGSPGDLPGRCQRPGRLSVPKDRL